MSLPALRLACLNLLAAAWMVPAGASCSRTITVSYASPIATVVYSALPERSLPSLADGIAKASGCKLEVADLPTIRAWRNFNDGRLDIVLVAIQTEDRDRLGDFVSTGTSPWVLITRRTEANPPRSLEDFNENRQLRLGVARGTAYPAAIEILMDRLTTNDQIDESADFGMALTKLANGRDAAALMISDAYTAVVAATGDMRFETIALPQLMPSKIGTYLNRQTLNAEDRKALMAGLYKVYDNGLADELVRARVPQLAGSQPKPH